MNKISFKLITIIFVYLGLLNFGCDNSPNPLLDNGNIITKTVHNSLLAGGIEITWKKTADFFWVSKNGGGHIQDWPNPYTMVDEFFIIAFDIGKYEITCTDTDPNPTYKNIAESVLYKFTVDQKDVGGRKYFAPQNRLFMWMTIIVNKKDINGQLIGSDSLKIMNQ